MNPTPKQLAQIAESINRITGFKDGYPKQIEVAEPYWQAFFDWEYELCLKRKAELNQQPSLSLWGK